MITKPYPLHLFPIKSLGNSKYASGMQTDAFLGLINGNLTSGFFLWATNSGEVLLVDAADSEVEVFVEVFWFSSSDFASLARFETYKFSG